MAEGLIEFRGHMDKVAHMASSSMVSSKVQRYVRAYEAGLPQDITVRWFPIDHLDAITARIAELTRQGLEAWISQGLPANRDVDQQLTSVEQRTDLIKGIKSVADYQERAAAQLRKWQPGSWAKVFYDTPQRALISGTMRIDTNRSEVAEVADLRALRLEASYGISDVRDLDRQMSARRIILIQPNGPETQRIENAVQSLGYSYTVLNDVETALTTITQIVMESKSANDPKAKPSEPRAVLLDIASLGQKGIQLLTRLKESKDTLMIPIILLCQDEHEFPAELRSQVASIVHVPISMDDVRLSIFLTGFRLNGGPRGLQIPTLGFGIQQRIDSLLTTVFGPNWAYLRRMVHIANIEQRPTIAFEFKIVPTDPYDFFFLDYEWSGPKHPFHRFDWLYTFGGVG